jgi:peptide/nickel transport system permease protein
MELKQNSKQITLNKQSGLWKSFRRLKNNRLAMLGLIILVLFIACAIFAPLLTPHDPLTTSLKDALQPSSDKHFLGTDELGRDLFSRLIYGARVSLSIGIISVAIGLSGGVSLGAISAYYGGVFDLIVQRIIDIMLAFPGILLAIVLVSVLGTGLQNVMIAVGISSVPKYVRLVRGSVLSIKEMEYITAAKALGLGDLRIIIRHILPNCLGPIIVQSTFQIALSILIASGLGFLGLGAQPPDPEWGAMLSRGRIYLRTDPFLTIYPGIAIFLVVLGFNLLGDGLRDALDPRTSNR